MIELNPLVSVIIPTYKRPDTLDRAIISVLRQTYQNVEVIVVDDNDPDTEGRALTIEKMKEFENNPKVIYIKHEKNKNGSAARNTGARASKGEYLAFLDDDDEFLPGKIESQLKRLRELSEDWGCCYSAYYTKKSNEKPVLCKVSNEGNLYLEALKRKLHIASGSNLMVRKSAFESISGFDESFIRNQDIEFLTRLLLKYKIAYSKEPGLIVNIHYNHSFFNEQDIINQYIERFKPFVESLPVDEQISFYHEIDNQRFWAFLSGEHDIMNALKMICSRRVSFFYAINTVISHGYIYIKRKFR